MKQFINILLAAIVLFNLMGCVTTKEVYNMEEIELDHKITFVVLNDKSAYLFDSNKGRFFPQQLIYKTQHDYFFDLPEMLRLYCENYNEQYYKYLLDEIEGPMQEKIVIAGLDIEQKPIIIEPKDVKYYSTTEISEISRVLGTAGVVIGSEIIERQLNK